MFKVTLRNDALDFNVHFDHKETFKELVEGARWNNDLKIWTVADYAVFEAMNNENCDWTEEAIKWVHENANRNIEVE